MASSSGRQVSYEDYVSMCGCAPVLGFEAMLAHYRIAMPEWTQIAGHWTSVIATNPQYMQHGLRVEQEAARIRAGGAPRPLSVDATGWAGSAGSAAEDPSLHAVSGAMPGAVPPPAYGAAQGYAGAAPAPYAPPGYAAPPPSPYAAAPGAGPYAPQPAYNQQAADLGRDVGNAFSAFGNALGSLVNSAVGVVAPGSAVMVQWSDGNRYPGTVTAAQSGQVQVAFPDGRRVWIPQQYVTPRG